MENLEMNAAFWRDKIVFMTGHTGFKGSWLSLWLQRLGARVYGYALEPSASPDMFTEANTAQGMARSVIADIRDTGRLAHAIEESGAQIVFHLAAQALVHRGYAEPLETYAINVMGTANLLEAIRHSKTVRSVVNVTTDKCYDNREDQRAYREDEPMGGDDPYSSSKACSELVTAAYRKSFFAQAKIAVATARSGNVIGGGDWASDRLIPDFFRAVESNMPLYVRSPNAVRPWQHVLEPLQGYLLLAENLFERGEGFAESWNFGPSDDDSKTVRWIAETLVEKGHAIGWEKDSSSHPHEANYLKLDSSKAKARLGWSPRWDLDCALGKTVAWHKAWRGNNDMRAFTLAQIAEYENSGGLTQ